MKLISLFRRLSLPVGGNGNKMDETLNALRGEKLAISAGDLTILVRSVDRKPSNLPNLEGKRGQNESKRRRSESRMTGAYWEAFFEGDSGDFVV